MKMRALPSGLAISRNSPQASETTNVRKKKNKEGVMSTFDEFHELFETAGRIIAFLMRGFEMAKLEKADMAGALKDLAEQGRKFVDLACEFGLPIAKQKGRILDYFRLGQDNWFLVERYSELEVDYDIPPEELRSRYCLSEYYVYAGARPGGKRKIKIALGETVHYWTEGKIVTALADPTSPFEGSGAWVAEAFLAAYPEDETPRWFPRSPLERWINQFPKVPEEAFPQIWYLDAYRRYMFMSSNTSGSCNRLCLVCKE